LPRQDLKTDLSILKFVVRRNASKIVIVFGLPGSGKSYFASQLANSINARYVNSDQLRKKMFESRTYSEEEKLSVYEEMLSIVKGLLAEYKNVVLDATFYKDEVRTKFLKELTGKAEIFFIEVWADESLIKERLKQKRPDSEADFATYEKVKKQWEPMIGDHLILQSTNDNISSMMLNGLKYYQQND
jgi:predicted kinase